MACTYCTYDKDYLLDIVKLLINNGAEIDYKIISYNVANDEIIFQLCIDRINFDDIEELKLIHSQINGNKIFINLLRLNILKFGYNNIDIMYISDLTMDKEDYNKIIELNNKSMTKRVN